MAGRPPQATPGGGVFSNYLLYLTLPQSFAIKAVSLPFLEGSIMGRKPKPLRLHLAQGTLRPHRAKISPQAGGELVKPSDLKGEAGKVWDRVVDFCTTAGGGECDIESLAGMCRWYAEFRKCWTCMEQMQITDEKYRRVQMCVANAWRCFVDMASRFGLSPADRTKLSEQPEAQLSALDQMMDRRS